MGNINGTLAGGIGLLGTAALTGLTVRAAESMLPKKKKEKKKASA